MKDPVLVTILLRGTIAVLLVFGGMWCVILGYKLLFKKNPNLSENSFEASIGEHKFTFSTGTAGAAVVFASVAWVLGAVLTVPSLEMAGGTTVAFGPEIIQSTGVERAVSFKFKRDRKSLTVAQKKSLELFVEQISSTNTSPMFVIEGFANIGTKEVNSAVAERRARAVKDYMVKHNKINPKYIQTRSYGETMPFTESGMNVVVLTATTKK